MIQDVQYIDKNNMIIVYSDGRQVALYCSKGNVLGLYRMTYLNDDTYLYEYYEEYVYKNVDFNKQAA